MKEVEVEVEEEGRRPERKVSKTAEGLGKWPVVEVPSNSDTNTGLCLLVALSPPLPPPAAAAAGAPNDPGAPAPAWSARSCRFPQLPLPFSLPPPFSGATAAAVAPNKRAFDPSCCWWWWCRWRKGGREDARILTPSRVMTQTPPWP